jgi:AcrR family transcriptional regulator
MKTVLDAVAQRLVKSDESLIRIPEICDATGVNYGSVYHHFGSREGVIDAAYAMIFTSLAEADIAGLRRISSSSSDFADYPDAMLTITSALTAGLERRERRSLRMRIVAASLTRPQLRTAIAVEEHRLSEELVRLAERGQERGWLRRDLTPRAIAVLVQVLLIGRTIDDISSTPIDDVEWAEAMTTVLRAGTTERPA